MRTTWLAEASCDRKNVSQIIDQPTGDNSGEEGQKNKELHRFHYIRYNMR
jgi:hypothetical protein